MRDVARSTVSLRDLSTIPKDCIVKRNLSYRGTRIKSVEDVFRLLKNQSNLKREVVTAVHLDNELNVLDVTTESVGGRNKALLPVENIFRGAILRNTETLLMVHNHPSGTLQPSSQDVEACRTIKEAGNIIGIPVMDCVIISTKGAIKI